MSVVWAVYYMQDNKMATEAILGQSLGCGSGRGMAPGACDMSIDSLHLLDHSHRTLHPLQSLYTRVHF